MNQFNLLQPICQQIWNQKYRFQTKRKGFTSDTDIVDTWGRIAHACANIPRLHNKEKERKALELRFFNALSDFKFLPAGRIQAGAGTERNVTLFNCFVMGTIPDDLGGIFDMLKEAALTMQKGGGIGYDFSTLRPSGDLVRGVESDASGPLSFMDVWDTMCRTIMSAGSRRGAMMATMRCDHPDIMNFITAKQDPLRLRNFNVSVLVTDPFMEAVEADKDWDLVFNDKIYSTMKARELWNAIIKNTYDFAEPGVIFIDRINKENNLWFLENISATNPCFAGDQMIWTAHGPKSFADIEGQRVLVLTENVAGKLVYRPMDVFKTAEDQQLVRVTLDDGTTIECTPNHEFFDLDRNRVEAQHLTPGQRLASVYRHNVNSKGYKRLTNGIDNPLEHHVPFEIVPDGFHVHHINEVKDDNRPENLELIRASEHNAMHIRGDRNPSNTHPQNHKVASVERLERTADVYCGTVKETHKFFLACERGAVLVSNCGEQPLPPYGACLLGSVNLAAMVKESFTPFATIDMTMLEETVRTGVRLLDSVIDISDFPLEAQREEAIYKRRMGLGVTGLADMLFMLGIQYGSESAVKTTDEVMQKIAIWAYEESIAMAQEIGFTLCLGDLKHREKFIQSEFMQRMPEYIRSDILKHGLRNSHLLSIAPTGTISMCAGNVSSGIEPIFAPFYDRKITRQNGKIESERVSVYSVNLFFKMDFTTEDDWWVDNMVTAQDLLPYHHNVMQAAAQKWVDSSISKTVNCPEDISFEDFQKVYEGSYALGNKGCTTYRPNEVTGSVLSVPPTEETDNDSPELPVEETLIMERPEAVNGTTYKLRWQGDAVYVTFNQVNIGEEGLVPFEMFVTSKNPEHSAWIAALTRMISAIFRRGGDVRFVVEEMKNVFDPKGGQFVNGHYVPSLVALLGQTLEQHMDSIEYQPTTESSNDLQKSEDTNPTQQQPDLKPLQKVPDQCPSCKGYNMIKASGCLTCSDCGHSKCG